jgi:hypothetical protein
MASDHQKRIIVDDGFSTNTTLRLLDLPVDLASMVLAGQR